MNRRDYLTLMGGATTGALAAGRGSDPTDAQEPRPADTGAPSTSTIEDRERRMKWWHEAKFGMFIHWGLYSTLGRHEWVMENEGIPVKEYETCSKKYHQLGCMAATNLLSLSRTIIGFGSLVCLSKLRS
jgi:alpha-L-fucosidase